MKPVFHRETVRTWQEDYTLKRTGEVRTRTRYEFVFVRVDGKPIGDHQLKWLQSLKIPPGVDHVEIFARGSEPQAQWTDFTGFRQQRLYSKTHRIEQSEKKFTKVGSLDAKIDKLRERVIDDLVDTGKPGEAAAVLYTILLTGMRVGEDKDTGATVKAYGVCTLESRHVQVSGNTVRFKFIGKKGVLQEHQIADASLARIIRDRKSGNSKNRLFYITAGAVRDYINGVLGIDTMTPKDLRTHLATSLVRNELKKVKRTGTKREFTAIRKELAEKASEKLGNTVAVALSGYVDPDVWTKVTPDKEEWRPAALKE